MEPITVKFHGIECTWFAIFTDPTLAETDLQLTFDVHSGDTPAIILPKTHPSTFRFVHQKKERTVRMSYKELGIGTWTIDDAVPTPADAERIQYTLLAVGMTQGCDPSNIPYYDLQSVYASARAVRGAR